MRAELLVVGAGIAGVSVAERASRKNLRVVVVEAVEPGAGATGRSAGIATVQMERLDDVLLSKRGVEIIESWAREYDLGPSVRRTGLVSVDWADELEDDLDVFRLAGVEYELVDNREARDRWGWLRVSEEEACLYTSMDLSIEPKLLVTLLTKRLEGVGVRVLRSSLVKLRAEGPRVKPVLSSGDTVEADQVVLATGAWTNKLLSTLNLRLDTAIIKCPIVVFRVDTRWDNVICFSDERHMSYWRPSNSPELTLVGGGYDAWLVDKPENALAKPPMDYPRKALRLLRNRVRFSVSLVDYYSGPCSIPSDFEPVVGRVPGYENLFIIEGLRGYGLARAPAIAEQLVYYMLTGRDVVPREYNPARAIRSLSR